MTKDLEDKAYELKLLHRIEAATVNGLPITQIPIAGDASLWHRFRTAVQGDIKRFAKTSSYKTYHAEVQSFKQHRIRAGVLFLFSVLVTFLASLWLILGRQKVLVLSIDKVSDKKTKSDFRIHRVYKTLSNNSISFVECFHTTLDKRLILSFFKRKRLALYLEAFDGMWFVYRLFTKAPSFDISSIDGTEDEIRFIKTTIKKYLAIKGLLEFRTKAIQAILSISNIKMVVGIDDVRHYQELMEAARNLGIQSTVVQHGHFTKYHVGWLGRDTYEPLRIQKADKIFVWSEYWKKELLRLGSVYSEDEIVIAGYPNKNARPSFLDEKNGKTVALVPHEREAPLDDVFAFIKEMSHCTNVEVFLKLRPDVPVNDQLAEYPGDVTSFVTTVTDMNTIPRPSVVVGVYSTFLYDMALVGIPILRMETSTDYGEGMVVNKLADKATLDDVCVEIQRCADTVQSVIAERVKTLDSERDFHDVLLNELKASGVV